MPRTRSLSFLPAVLLALTILALRPASAQTGSTPGDLPHFLARPLAYLAAGYVAMDAASADYLVGVTDPARCERDPPYRLRLEGIGLVTAYYGLAERLFLGGRAGPGSWGYPVHDDWTAQDRGRSGPSAGDLLKSIPPERYDDWLAAAAAMVPAADRARLLASLGAYRAAYDPMMAFIAEDEAAARMLLADLFAGRVGPMLDGTRAPLIGSACDQALVYLYTAIGGSDTYLALPPIASVTRTFWLRRFGEGNQRLALTLLDRAIAALEAQP